MTDKDIKNTVNSFAVQISRELGQITAHLANIEKDLNDQANERGAIWKRLDENRASIRKLEDAYLVIRAKVAVVSGFISFAVWFVVNYFKRFF